MTQHRVLFGYVRPTYLSCTYSSTLADSRFSLASLYQGGVKSTVSRVFEDLKFKILEGSDQFWSQPSEILNIRSSTIPETVDFTPPYTKLGETPNLHTFSLNQKNWVIDPICTDKWHKYKMKKYFKRILRIIKKDSLYIS